MELGLLGDNWPTRWIRIIRQCCVVARSTDLFLVQCWLEAYVDKSES
jgi:hypothetical protein